MSLSADVPRDEDEAESQVHTTSSPRPLKRWPWVIVFGAGIALGFSMFAYGVLSNEHPIIRVSNGLTGALLFLSFAWYAWLVLGEINERNLRARTPEQFFTDKPLFDLAIHQSRFYAPTLEEAENMESPVLWSSSRRIRRIIARMENVKYVRFMAKQPYSSGLTFEYARSLGYKWTGHSRPLPLSEAEMMEIQREILRYFIASSTLRPVRLSVVGMGKIVKSFGEESQRYYIELEVT